MFLHVITHPPRRHIQEWRYRRRHLGLKRVSGHTHAQAGLSPGNQSSVPTEQQAGRVGLNAMAKRRICYHHKWNIDPQVIRDVA